MQQHEPVDAEFGRLLNQLIEPVALRHRRRDRGRCGSLVLADDAVGCERHSCSVAHEPCRPPPARSIGDRDRFPVAPPQDTNEVLLRGLVERDRTVTDQLFGRDEDVCRTRPAQRQVVVGDHGSLR